MKLPYRRFKRGGFVIYQPVISVLVAGEPFDALVDTGADINSFPTDKPLLFTALTGKQPSTPAMKVAMSITEEGTIYTWEGLATFSKTIERPLLGWLGFLEYFDVTLDNRRRVLEFKPNKAYTGTAKSLWSE